MPNHMNADDRPISSETPCSVDALRHLQNHVLESVATGRPLAAVMDLLCREAERLAPDGSKGFYTEALDRLPDGVFVTLDGCPKQAYLVWGDRLLAWSPGGYQERRPRPKEEKVVVLTPPSTVRALAAGFQPVLHPSARNPSASAGPVHPPACGTPAASSHPPPGGSV